MISLITFVLALVVLYLLSRVFITKLFAVLFAITRNEKRASYLLALIFLPGTFVHEISHLLTAFFLLVPVGELNLIPEYTGKGVRMGSVAIGKADIFRNSLIGIAPFIVGIGIILGILGYGISSNNYTNPLYILFAIYVIFQITHTMFSSKRDLQSVTELLVLSTLIVSIMLIAGLTEPFVTLGEIIESNRVVIEQMSYYLFIPIGLELMLLLIFNKVKA